MEIKDQTSVSLQQGHIQIIHWEAENIEDINGWILRQSILFINYSNHQKLSLFIQIFNKLKFDENFFSKIFQSKNTILLNIILNI